MKRSVKAFLMAIIVLLLLPMIVFADDADENKTRVERFTEKYDALLESKELVLYTDATITSSTDENYMTNVVSTFLGYYYKSDERVNGNYYYYYLRVDSCQQSTMVCNLRLDLQTSPNVGESTTEEVKKYENIKITVSSKDVDTQFKGVLKDGSLVLNYDESMFDYEYEKINYANGYLSKISTYSNYLYYDSGANVIWNYDRYNHDLDDEFKPIYAKKVNSIKFEYKEDAYSEDFKKFAQNGVVKIKTNEEISSYVVSRYISALYRDYGLTGSFKNSKSYVIRYGYDEETQERVELEKHLVTFEAIDVDVKAFDSIITDGKYVVKTGLEISKDRYYSYVGNYFNTFKKDVKNSDGSSYYYSYYDISSYSKNMIITLSKYDKDDKMVDYQMYKVPFEFTDYEKTSYSDNFKKDIGDKLVVHSNEASESNIRTELYSIKTNGYSYNLVGCNNDLSVCDIVRNKYNDNDKVTEHEMHQVNIVFDDTVSEKFKKAFNLGNDDKIEIIMSSDIDLSYVYLYIYNDETDDQFGYSCSSGKCTLSLTNYYDSLRENHKLDLDYKEIGKTDYYKKNVLEKLEVYPGINEYFYWGLAQEYLFSKDENFYTKAMNCNEKTKTCEVYIITEKYGIEVHKVPFEVKEGKSPEMEAILPGDSISVPIAEPEVEKGSYTTEDGEKIEYESYPEYVYDTLNTYLKNSTKSDVEVKEIKEGKTVIEYNDIEQQEYELKFVKRDEAVDAEVKKAQDKIAEIESKFIIDDLELINNFYYNKSHYSGNSVTVGLSSLERMIMDSVGNKNIVASYLGNQYYGCGLASSGSEDECEGNYPYYETYSQPNFALFALYYNGVAYNSATAMYRVNYVLYVPSDTKDTVEDYAKAAQKRIDEYLGKDSGVVVKYSEPLSEKYLSESQMDLSKSDKNIYRVIHKDKEIEVLIIKENKTTEKPVVEAQDIINKVLVKIENSIYPTDTIVNSQLMEETKEEFKEILEVLEAETAQVIDISLYSPTTGDITDFSKGAKFKVSVPITNPKLIGKLLTAFYLDKDNKVVSEHEVDVDADNMATFETDHFSRYVFVEKAQAAAPVDPSTPATPATPATPSTTKPGATKPNTPSNPNTGDSIFYFVGMAFIAVIGLLSSKKYINREN